MLFTSGKIIIFPVLFFTSDVFTILLTSFELYLLILLFNDTSLIPVIFKSLSKTITLFPEAVPAIVSLKNVNCSGVTNLGLLISVSVVKLILPTSTKSVMISDIPVSTSSIVSIGCAITLPI